MQVALADGQSKIVGILGVKWNTILKVRAGHCGVHIRAGKSESLKGGKITMIIVHVFEIT